MTAKLLITAVSVACAPVFPTSAQPGPIDWPGPVKEKIDEVLAGIFPAHFPPDGGPKRQKRASADRAGPPYRTKAVGRGEGLERRAPGRRGNGWIVLPRGVSGELPCAASSEHVLSALWNRSGAKMVGHFEIGNPADKAPLLLEAAAM